MAKRIIKINPTALIKLLNKALADEWLAYYQYWVGAKVAEGPLRPEVQAELVEHAKEELEHAEMLANRITQLGGKPILSPNKWKGNCRYIEPKNPLTTKLLEQNIKGEQCAILVYKKLMGKVKGKDTITFNIARKIMADEIEHEQDLQDLQNDIKLSKK